MDDEVKIVVQRWLAKAENDLATATIVLREKPHVTDTVCFHAQQCMEKALKAHLTHVGIHVEKTHYLPVLLEQCTVCVPEFEQLREHAQKLTDYAVEVRYIDDWREIPFSEAKEAIILAAAALEFVRQQLSNDSASP